MTEPVFGNPAGAIASAAFSIFSGGKRTGQTKARIEALNLPPELEREALRDAREIIAERNTPEGAKGVKLQRMIAGYVKAAEDYEAEEPEPPDFDDVSSGSSTVADQQLSPVFAAAAIGGAGGSLEAAKIKAIQKALKLEKDLARRAESRAESKRLKKAQQSDVRLMRALGAAAIRAAVATFPKAAKVAKRGARVAKGAKLPKVGGGGASIFVLGAQYGIEKGSEILADRQFRGMEKILEKQQRETDAIIKRGRTRPNFSGVTSGASTKPAKALAQSTAPRRARAPLPAPGLAPKPLPSAVNTGTSVTSPPRSKGQVLWGKTVPGSGAPSPARATTIVNMALDALKNLRRSSSSNFSSFSPSPASPASPSPGASPSYFSSPSRLASQSGQQICYTRRPASKRRRKKTAKRVCVAESTARKYGISTRSVRR